MSSKIGFTPYFYIIEHISSKIQYAGSKWGKDANPTNFMTKNGYQTSSEEIKNIIKYEGLNAFKIIEIILEEEIKIPFGWNNIYDYESWFLQSNSVASSKLWFNQHENEGKIKFGSKQFSNIIMAKYGTEWPLQAESIKDKRTITWFVKYGTEWPMQSEIIKNKGKQTKLENHGDSNYNNIDQMKLTKLDKYGNANYNNNDKNKLTCSEKYGVENPFQSKEIMEIAKQTKLDKYGNENYNNREKSKSTSLEKYGETHYTKTKENRLRASESAKRQRANEPILTCPHCDKSGKGPKMISHHFDNCKSKI